MTRTASSLDQLRDAVLAMPMARTLQLAFRRIDASRLLTVCAADVYAVDGERQTRCAMLLDTARNIDTTGARA